MRTSIVRNPQNAGMFLHKLCYLYCTLDGQTTPVSVVLLGDIGLHQTRLKIATDFGPGGQHLRDRDGVFLQQFVASVLRGAPGASN